MTPLQNKRRRLSRRRVLQLLGLAPLLLRSTAFRGLSLLSTAPMMDKLEAEGAFEFADLRLKPHYPAKSPLEDVLRLVPAGSDAFVSEKYAYEIGLILQQWSHDLQAGRPGAIGDSLDAELRAASFTPARETILRNDAGMKCVARTFPADAALGRLPFLKEFAAWLGDPAAVETAAFQITSVEERQPSPLRVQMRIRYSIVARTGGAGREQRVGDWLLDWTRHATAGEDEAWKVTRWQTQTERRSTVRGPGFVDVTEAALGSTASYRAQMLHGSDYWRSVLDGACGVDVYGNNGVAAGDFDNDGFDDLYVCQPAGLPNRLYRNRGDGTFEDVTEKAGVGVLDNTACALFADLRNLGLQDLLVVCGSGPLLFLNQGDGTFQRKRDAFQFAQAPQGTFTHASIADYDGDGRLDIYFCVYSYYLGLEQYHYPAPYFDARNGPPNFLLHNQGDASFVDRTEAAGLHAENDRYSFACAWGQSETGGLPDLYVVNDFGRSNLYRNNGDGTFRAVSSTAHTQEAGAGMSACWLDYNNDQRQDLYAANMWSAAGQRISQQGNFHQKSTEAVRTLYRRHASGNALYRSRGDGSFDEVGEQAGAAMGRWAWCSDAWDFDHDGYPDLYIANGYITAPARVRTGAAGGASGQTSHAVQQGARPDLDSFFWRQVVGNSPDDATPSLAYEHGWNALNELIRSDSPWNGSERNVLLTNNRDGTFSEVSGAVGLDFLEDGRSFALADLDHDGRLEVVLKNRNAPQLRIVRNNLEELGDSIVFRLRGTKSNRDAIGAAVTVVAGELRQTKYLQAGSGFLAQHSKELFFGIGKGSGTIQATVQWPSGLSQRFDGLPRNSRIALEEGAASLTAKPFTMTAKTPANTETTASAGPEQIPLTVETWLIDPLKAPGLRLPDATGAIQSLNSMQGQVRLLYFWSTQSPRCMQHLQSFQRSRASIDAAHVRVIAVNVDDAAHMDSARAVVAGQRLSYPVLFADDQVAGIYNIVFRYLYDRRTDLAIPTAMLLDGDGMIVKVYQGALTVEGVLADVRGMPATPGERMQKALPFAGTRYQGDFARNDFTYGVAMFQHGYLEQAAESFRQVVAARPNDADGYYNLGTLSLRRNDFAQARRYLERTLELKPAYPEAWNNLGLMAAQEGNPQEAIRNFRQALALRPGYATAWLNLGNVYRRGKQFMDAQDCLTRALALQPDDPEANYSLGMFYAQQGQLPPAGEYLQKAVLLRPDYPEALNNLGVLLVREQEYARAEQQFLACIRLVPQFDESYLNLARLYVVQQERAKAQRTLRDLLRLRPESAAAKQGLQQLDSMQ